MAHDFTIEVAWTCASNEYWETTVQGSKGDLYTVRFGLLSEAEADERRVSHDWQCECQGYRFRGTCKHIAQVKASGARCGWNGAIDPGLTPAIDADGHRTCPQCGGRVKPIRVAV